MNIILALNPNHTVPVTRKKFNCPSQKNRTEAKQNWGRLNMESRR